MRVKFGLECKGKAAHFKQVLSRRGGILWLSGRGDFIPHGEEAFTPMSMSQKALPPFLEQDKSGPPWHLGIKAVDPTKVPRKGREILDTINQPSAILHLK
jgi:hypothetical protein